MKNNLYKTVLLFFPLLLKANMLLFVNVHAESDSGISHYKVFYEEGMLGGWPANHGIWIWENEILTGFAKGYHKDLGPERHSIDRDTTELHLLARSLDGGKSWRIEDPGKKSGALVVPDHGGYHGRIRSDVALQPLRTCDEGIHFGHPDFALTARMSDIHAGLSRFWYSYDRGHHWTGPCKIPNFGTPGTAARTDYIVNDNQNAMLFVTAAKSNGREGRPMMIQTMDGGREWVFRSWIGSEPDGFSIMPASVRLPENELLVTVRRREGAKRFISAYLSTNNGSTWSHVNDPVEDAGIGNPPAMIRLKDGRIGLVYGHRRDHGSSLYITFSSDSGRTWGDAIELRGGDGAGRDIGYPRMVQRADGKLVIVYYWNHSLQENAAPYRYIAATIVDPDKL